MIKKLTIQNFLSHKNTELEFSDGVNIILGATDSGKSVFVHAINWLKDNRPFGSSFRSNWGGNTKVEIITDERVITRTKTDKENIYSVGALKTQKFLEFKAFKSSIPDEVQKALNMSEINVQSQFDPFFLLNKSPGDVAQYFNKVANLDKIDLSRNKAQAIIRQLEGDLKAARLDLDRRTEDLKQYRELDTIEGIIVDIEGINRQLNKKHSQVQYMTEVVSDYQSLDKKKEKESKLLSAEPLINFVLECSKKIEELYESKESLRFLYMAMKSNEKYINQIDNFIGAEKLVLSLLKINADLYGQKNELEKFEVLINYISLVIQSEKKLKNDLEKFEKEFHKNLGEVCPLCGEKITSGN